MLEKSRWTTLTSATTRDATEIGSGLPSLCCQTMSATAQVPMAAIRCQQATCLDQEPCCSSVLWLHSSELQGPVQGNVHPTVGDLLPADVPFVGPRTIPQQKVNEEGVGVHWGCVKGSILLLVRLMLPFGDSL